MPAVLFCFVSGGDLEDGSTLLDNDIQKQIKLHLLALAVPGCGFQNAEVLGRQSQMKSFGMCAP